MARVARDLLGGNKYLRDSFDFVHDDDDEPVFIVGVGPATAHVPTPWHYTTYMCSSRSVAMVMVWSVMVGRCSGDVSHVLHVQDSR